MGHYLPGSTAPRSCCPGRSDGRAASVPGRMQTFPGMSRRRSPTKSPPIFLQNEKKIGKRKVEREWSGNRGSGQSETDETALALTAHGGRWPDGSSRRIGARSRCRWSSWRGRLGWLTRWLDCRGAGGGTGCTTGAGATTSTISRIVLGFAQR